MNINISILMPIYNGIEFIEESVSSILKQTYTNWELLIGINGHLPNSEIYQIAKNYESNKIRVFDFHNIKGKSNTLNEMVNYCSYDHVALLDVDDIWHEKKLSYQVPHLEKKENEDYDVVGTRCIYIGDLNGVVPKIPTGDLISYDFLKSNPMINSSVIIKKEYCYWYENGIEDYDMWLRLRRENKRFYNCNEILVKHRIHQQSAFNANGKNQKLVKNLLETHKNKKT